MTTLRAEIRKLQTVRSTYIIVGLALLISFGINFWPMAYKYHGPADPHYYFSNLLGTLNGLGILAGIIAILLITHEYRYNTIYYTLTANRRRSQVFLAKVFVITILAIMFSVLVVAVGYVGLAAGLQLGHHDVGSQAFPFAEFAGRGLLYIWGVCMFAALFGLIIRNQIGTIVTYLIAPNTIESLAGIVLKDNVKYLPFTSLANLVIQVPGRAGGSLSLAVTVILIWLAGLTIVAWLLFLRRDAN